ncbi:MFS domain-containing protein [Mycena chlorophos]|uniref:MFS domain-containing protein n=1 Tax=Mycena chlorophos TaxID=658473 RepID=A0A8H6W801_MYCCL|nr:MFS domain-containing protein [Mycena chlorophos]
MSSASHTLRDDADANSSSMTKPEQPAVALDDSENPIHWSTFKKWLALVVISSGCFCASFTEPGMARDFHASHEVTVLTISFFILGLGIGPLVTGPFSEVYGRAIIYRVSYLLLVLFGIPLAIGPSLAVVLVFRFLQGLAGASFLSVAGGSVADMFLGPKVATPMAFYTASPFLGPTFGPAVAGFINQNLDWRWTFRICLVWMFCELIAILLFVPESYAPVLLKRKAARLRKETGDDNHWAPLDRRETSMGRMLYLSCTVPFKLLIFDRMALLLDIWTALLLGIMYLFFQVFPIIFEDGHHFNMQTTGLTFLSLGGGIVLALGTQPWWNRRTARVAKENGGKPPPETTLVMGQAGGVIVPIGMFMFAFTSYPHVHWIGPLISAAIFGTGMLFAFTATFTYLVMAYRPIAASAMAANSALRSTFGAIFPLFAASMYARLGTVGATALLAGLTTVMLPLPFIFYKIGPRLRETSRFAV